MNSNPAQKPTYVFVDVDDTLVRSVGKKRIPMPSVIEHVRELHAQGAVLYCWSAGGEDYARSSAEEFGIAACFTAFLSKPNVLIDDESPEKWLCTIRVHPNGCSGKTLADYRRELD